MRDFDFKKIAPHLLAVVIFIAIAFTYFSPVLEGKKLKQGDIVNFMGMSKEVRDHREKYDEEALWTNSMFGGMPAYQVSMAHPGNWMFQIDRFFKLWFPSPVNFLFIYLIGFYILLCSLKIDYRLSIIGAIAFAFSSYFFIIIEAGHNTKAQAIAYMAPVLAGFLLAYNGKRLAGAALVALFFGLELKSNHLQITYYLGLILLICAIFKLIEAVKQKQLPEFIKTSIYVLLAIVLSLGTSFSNIWTTYEYGELSIRGKSELTNLNKENQTSGLDKDYATAWSYGIGETFTLLVPDFKGSLSEPISASPELLKDVSRQNQQLVGYAHKYHGDQPFTSGPVYVGAIVLFLFVLGMFILDGNLKWILFSATVLSIVLSWGKNFMGPTDFFFDYIPGYNKFRSVSMILVIAELTIPLLAFLALDKIFKNPSLITANRKPFYISIGLTAGVCLLMYLLPTMFTDFSNVAADGNLTAQLTTMLESQKMPAPQVTSYLAGFFEEVEAIRENMLKADALRSCVLVLLAAAILFLVSTDRLKVKVAIIALGVMVFGDMWMVNKRFINNEKVKGKYTQWITKRKADNPHQANAADLQILADKDPNYRVFNTTIRLDQDSRTCYFHKSLGGYHGAKLRRYQELITAHLVRRNMDVVNMLNTKYFIISGSSGEPQAIPNPDALGNAWFVDRYKMVENADSELTALSSFSPKRECIVDMRFKEQLNNYQSTVDSGSTIRLTSYKANHLVYEANCAGERIAVFSEIYYAQGWNMYVDGEQKPYFRCNYVLRGAVLQAGKHNIEFKFEPVSYDIGSKISLASSILLILFVCFAGYKELIVTKD